MIRRIHNYICSLRRLHRLRKHITKYERLAASARYNDKPIRASYYDQQFVSVCEQYEKLKYKMFGILSYYL